jgi:hypothetical protein
VDTSQYRFPPREVDLGDRILKVYEDKCMCGSCDTVHVVVTDKHDGSVLHYNRDHAIDLDCYDQITELKEIILGLLKLNPGIGVNL